MKSSALMFYGTVIFLFCTIPSHASEEVVYELKPLESLGAHSEDIETLLGNHPLTITKESIPANYGAIDLTHIPRSSKCVTTGALTPESETRDNLIRYDKRIGGLPVTLLGKELIVNYNSYGEIPKDASIRVDKYQVLINNSEAKGTPLPPRRKRMLFRSGKSQILLKWHFAEIRQEYHDTRPYIIADTILGRRFLAIGHLTVEVKDHVLYANGEAIRRLDKREGVVIDGTKVLISSEIWAWPSRSDDLAWSERIFITNVFDIFFVILVSTLTAVLIYAWRKRKKGSVLLSGLQMVGLLGVACLAYVAVVLPMVAVHRILDPHKSEMTGKEIQEEKFIDASIGGNNEQLKQYLSQGIDVNCYNIRGRTALISAAEKGNLKTVQFLLAEGADVNASDNRGSTALYEATCDGHLGVVKVLLENGADVNRSTNDGLTPLMSCSWSHKNAEDIADMATLLIKHGANINAQSAGGWTPLMRAMNDDFSGTLYKLLIRRGADVNTVDEYGRTPLSYAKEELSHLDDDSRRSIIRDLLDAGAVE